MMESDIDLLSQVSVLLRLVGGLIGAWAARRYGYSIGIGIALGLLFGPLVMVILYPLPHRKLSRPVIPL